MNIDWLVFKADSKHAGWLVQVELHSADREIKSVVGVPLPVNVYAFTTIKNLYS